MAKEGITGQENIIAHYKAICEIVEGDVSAEVIATDFEGMISEGIALSALHPQIVVKIPMILEGIKAIKYFADKGIKTNCTLVFSTGQAASSKSRCNICVALYRSFGRCVNRWSSADRGH